MSKVPSKKCGLIMPISAIDSCSAEHWSEVNGLITESIESITDYNFKVSMVSDADEIGVIQKRIVQNIYSSDIVVCDVSGKNPNVMFELGLRLAFDKPTVIVKDESTDYSFDTSIIEHVTYPRDLRFSKIVLFKKKLAEKVAATYKKSEEDPDHSIFLKNFGQFKVANLSENIVTSDKLIIETLSDMQHEIRNIRSQLSSERHRKTPVRRTLPDSIKIKRAAQTWSDSNNCKLSDLLNNDDFIDFAENKISDLSRYSTRDNFADKVNSCLEELIN